MNRTITHGHWIGHKPTPTWTTWSNMKRRCQDPTNAYYHRYGARGITICERWASFPNFLADMGEKPQGLTLDRIDNEKGYSPENCQWSSRLTQTRNSAKTKLTPDDVRAIRALCRAGLLTQTQIGAMFGVCSNHVSSINRGHKWGDVQ